MVFLSSFDQFALIGAHLQPRDVDQWLKTAELAIGRNELRTALNCYSKGRVHEYMHMWILCICMPAMAWHYSHTVANASSLHQSVYESTIPTHFGTILESKYGLLVL